MLQFDDGLGLHLVYLVDHALKLSVNTDTAYICLSAPCFPFLCCPSLLFQLSLEEQSICTDVFAVMCMSGKEGSLAFHYCVCSILLAGRNHLHKALFLSLSSEMRPENSVAL